MRPSQILIMMFSDSGLPQDGLAAAFLIENDLQDSIGLSSIVLTSGTIADLSNATWGFPINAVTIQADTDIGGGVLFSAGVPIVRSGAEWYALFNATFAWIGFHVMRGGIVFYSTDKSIDANRIQDYLGRYAPDATFVVDGADFVVDGSDFITDGV